MWRQSSLIPPVIMSFFHKNRRIIVSYSEKLKVRDEKKRQRLLEKLEGLCKEGKISAGQLIKKYRSSPVSLRL